MTVPLAIPFPTFNPVAIAIGPFAIRWYALAYIAGIVLGWIYARAILKSELGVAPWPGPFASCVYDACSALAVYRIFPYRKTNIPLEVRSDP